MFFKRLSAERPPWTDDAILREYKFTNAYRASDRVSQYLIRNVIYSGDDAPEEVLFRTLVFKVFNRIDTWLLLQRSIGEVSFTTYDFTSYDRALTAAIDQGQAIYSSAYIMPSGGRNSKHARKHRMHLRLIEQMMRDELAARLTRAPSMAVAFDLLRSYPTIGDFLAYQFITDLNYSTMINFSEMQFVVPGPGARSGLRKCFASLGGLSEAEMIKRLADHQRDEFERVGVKFQSLWGRELQLIDCQNLFCELDKYARVAFPGAAGIGDRRRIKHRFHPTMDPIDFWYPPKWGINDLVPATRTDSPARTR